MVGSSVLYRTVLESMEEEVVVVASARGELLALFFSRRGGVLGLGCFIGDRALALVVLLLLLLVLVLGVAVAVVVVVVVVTSRNLRSKRAK